MYTKVFVNLFVFLLLSVIELSFINALPWPLNVFNLILVTAVFTLSLNGLEKAFWLALIVGFVLDSVSFFPFGLNMISLLLSVLFSYIFLQKILTNRSLYSYLTLIGIATVINHTSRFIYLYFYKLIRSDVSYDLSWKIFFSENILYELILNLLAAIAVFYVLNFISHRLKPVFIIGRKNENF